MTPQTPLLLLDNVFDNVTLYPGAVVGASAERTGHEAYRVADYRRERTSWQPDAAAALHYVESDLGAGVAKSVDFVYIDRGHNLWDKTVYAYGDDGSGGSSATAVLTVPTQGTLGGDPTSTMLCVTEEGALYCLTGSIASLGAHRRWRVYVEDNMLPVIPGIILGERNQLLGYSNVFDEDAADRTEVSSVSTAGYQATDMTYSWRTVKLGLGLIGATEYDGAIRRIRDTMFKRNQPWVCAMDYGTHPERAWMYQYAGKSWSMKKSRVYRDGEIIGREVGASLS